MCGIFGYIGTKNASGVILDGLKRLEYRGYDSWGVAVLTKNGIKVAKKVGAIGDYHAISSLPKSTIGIGHTRWATHGGVTYKNAHPHFSTDKSFVLAQNGIVENYIELKKSLVKEGFKFTTQTDTEIIVRLVEKYRLKGSSLKKAVIKAFKSLKGRNTIVVLDSLQRRVIAIRNGSPLVVGIGKEEYFFASDTLSFADRTNDVVYIEDMQMVVYEEETLSVTDLSTLKMIAVKPTHLNHKDVLVNKDGYEHFMLKEIMEERHVLSNAVNYSLQDLKPLLSAIKKANTVFTIGAGGAFLAADQVAYLLRSIAGIKAVGMRAYEIDSYSHFFQKGDVVIAISQSGETADTIEALKVIKAKGVKVASAVNMLGSTITRMSDYPFFSRSGSEICVLSTKSGVAEVAFGYMLAHAFNGIKVASEIQKLETYLDKKYLTKDFIAHTKRIAKKIAKRDHAFLLGKGANYLVASIGALNIKEASCVHAEGFAAGELKHGVIALIEKGTPVITFVDTDSDHDYMISATAEVKARGAFVIGIGVENHELFDEFIPLPTLSKLNCAIIANIIPCQLLAYHLAVLKGLNPDKPRNLAKSVTVK